MKSYDFIKWLIIVCVAIALWALLRSYYKAFVSTDETVSTGENELSRNGTSTGENYESSRDCMYFSVENSAVETIVQPGFPQGFVQRGRRGPQHGSLQPSSSWIHLCPSGGISEGN